MGVPSFYRWLAERYPLVVEQLPDAGCSSRPDAHGGAGGVDNLYIDMNGVIHPCFHPEGGAQPKSEREVFEAILKYVDGLLQLVRPRRLLYLRSTGRRRRDEPAALAPLQVGEGGGGGAAREGRRRRRRLDGLERDHAGHAVHGDARAVAPPLCVRASQPAGAVRLAAAAHHRVGRVGAGRGRAQDHVVHPRPAPRARRQPEPPPLHPRVGRRPHHARTRHPRGALLDPPRGAEEGRRRPRATARPGRRPAGGAVWRGLGARPRPRPPRVSISRVCAARGRLVGRAPGVRPREGDRRLRLPLLLRRQRLPAAHSFARDPRRRSRRAAPPLQDLSLHQNRRLPYQRRRSQPLAHRGAPPTARRPRASDLRRPPHARRPPAEEARGRAAAAKARHGRQPRGRFRRRTRRAVGAAHRPRGARAREQGHVRRRPGARRPEARATTIRRRRRARRRRRRKRRRSTKANSSSSRSLRRRRRRRRHRRRRRRTWCVWASLGGRIGTTSTSSVSR